MFTWARLIKSLCWARICLLHFTVHGWLIALLAGNGFRPCLKSHSPSNRKASLPAPVLVLLHAAANPCNFTPFRTAQPSSPTKITHQNESKHFKSLHCFTGGCCPGPSLGTPAHRGASMTCWEMGQMASLDSEPAVAESPVQG